MNEGKDNRQPEGIAPVRSTDLLGFTWICDPKWTNRPEPFYGKIEGGYVWWRGEKREVLDIHLQTKGSQLQLA